MASGRELKIRANVDGGARGNPGPAAAGFVLRDAGDDEVLLLEGIFLGEATNNVAEYRGLIAALQRAAHLGAREVEVFSDSQLLVRQMTGQYRVKNETLKALFRLAQELAGGFEKFAVRHVPREQNKQADSLVNRAINLRRTVHDVD